MPEVVAASVPEVEPSVDVVRKSRTYPEKRDPVKQDDIPDVYNLSVKEIKNLKLDRVTAKSMLQVEEQGLNRKTVEQSGGHIEGDALVFITRHIQ